MAGRYAWPLHLVALVDELKEFQVPTIEILGVETTIRDIFRSSLFTGALTPKELLGEALARESLAETTANAARDRLIDDPDCTVRLRQLDHDLGVHEQEIARARLVIQRDLAVLEAAEPAVVS